MCWPWGQEGVERRGKDLCGKKRITLANDQYRRPHTRAREIKTKSNTSKVTWGLMPAQGRKDFFHHNSFSPTFSFVDKFPFVFIQN